MLTLKEHIELNQVNEAWYAEFPPEVIAKADHYSIVFNPITQRTVIRLLDDQYQNLGEVEYESAELAIAFIEEYFELDDDDTEWLEGYHWADEESVEIEESTKRNVNEMLDPIETLIERRAAEMNVRIAEFDNDAMFDDGGFGISVVFHRNNREKNVEKFVKDLEREILMTYGAKTKYYDGERWDIAL